MTSMGNKCLFTAILWSGLWGPCGSATAEEINVASALFGADARASSITDLRFIPDNILDGPPANVYDLWASEPQGGNEPHWIIVNFPAAMPLHKVVLKHAGILDKVELNTCDFRLQRGDSPEGPWIDLVEPITGNKEKVTTHTFAPAPVHYLRLFITKAEQESNRKARIYEICAYTDSAAFESPLLEVHRSAKYRLHEGKMEELVRLRTTGPLPTNAVNIELHVGDSAAIPLSDWDGQELKACWLPCADVETMTELTLSVEIDGVKRTTARGWWKLAPPAYFATGAVNVIPASHNDIAILYADDETFEHRSGQLITPALELMKADPDYCFSMECTLYLMDYLQRRPEMREEIGQRIREGRFEWGGTYTMPFESLFPGESLVRQVYLGRKWLRKNFEGCDTRVVMNADVPQRALQMSQILHKAGVKYLILWRGFPEGFYNWCSPDGSWVTAYGYGEFPDRINWIKAQGNYLYGTPVTVHENYFTGLENDLSPQLRAWGQWFRTMGFPPEMPVVDWFDYEGPTVYRHVMKKRDETAGKLSAAAQGNTTLFPPIRYSTFAMMMDRVASAKPKLRSFMGERQCPWFYEHAAGHHKAVTAGRDAARLLTSVEKFAAMDATLAGDFSRYPAYELNRVWEAQAYTDHGYGGDGLANGERHDQFFLGKLEAARDQAQKLLDRTIETLAARITVSKEKAVPIVIFNALSWQRSDPVRCSVDLAGFGAGATGFRIVDAQGREVPCQRLPVDALPGASPTAANIAFIAADVPAIGYMTYYAVPVIGPPGAVAGSVDLDKYQQYHVTGVPRPRAVPHPPGDAFENEFYRIRFGPSGVTSIFDKQSNRELLKTGKFSGLDMITMHSKGPGAFGDTRYNLPTMEDFDKLSNYKTDWQCEEFGPIFTSFVREQTTPHCNIRQKVIVYQGIKRIDVEASLIGWDGTKNREWRLVLPLSMSEAQVAYDVPFGVVRVGKDEAVGSEPEGYVPANKEHPRDVQDWINASNATLGVTLSSSTAVCDFVDPTPDPLSEPVLGPLLLATRQSGCTGGVAYIQPGDHDYQFSITSGQPGWERGYRFGSQARNPLIAVVVEQKSKKSDLPEQMSFCSVDLPNVIISAMKKCENDDSIIVRCYDVAGRDGEANIKTSFPVERAELTNIIEEEGKPIDSRPNDVTVKIGHHSIETIKLVPGLNRVETTK